MNEYEPIITMMLSPLFGCFMLALIFESEKLFKKFE